MDKTTFSQRVRARRLELGLGQSELGKLSGTTQANISNIENGLRQGTTNIGMLAAALGVNPIWLQTGKGEKEPLSDLALNIARRVSELPTDEQARLSKIIEAVLGAAITDKQVEQKMPITKGNKTTS